NHAAFCGTQGERKRESGAAQKMTLPARSYCFSAWILYTENRSGYGWRLPQCVRISKMSITEHELNTWLAVLRATHWLNQQLARDMMKEDHIRINWYDVLIHLEHCADPARGMRM